jgi:hypothetical protein
MFLLSEIGFECNGFQTCGLLVNTMIGTVDGTVFHDAVDTSGKVKDAELLSDILSRCIEKVGAENVVLVVTDNASNCVKAAVCFMHTCIHFITEFYRISELAYFELSVVPCSEAQTT